VDLAILLELALSLLIVLVDGIATPNLLNQLILRQRSLQSFNLITLRGQYISATLVDVLQEQDLDVLRIEGF
jgi:hypothetical protein